MQINYLDVFSCESCLAISTSHLIFFHLVFSSFDNLNAKSLYKMRKVNSTVKKKRKEQAGCAGIYRLYLSWLRINDWYFLPYQPSDHLLHISQSTLNSSLSLYCMIQRQTSKIIFRAKNTYNPLAYTWLCWWMRSMVAESQFASERSTCTYERIHIPQGFGLVVYEC